MFPAHPTRHSHAASRALRSHGLHTKTYLDVAGICIDEGPCQDQIRTAVRKFAPDLADATQDAFTQLFWDVWWALVECSHFIHTLLVLTYLHTKVAAI
jgi:hypothetical protein